jgi:uncharacterized protein (DUF1684 family)
MIRGQLNTDSSGLKMALTRPKINASQMKASQFVFCGTMPFPFMMATAAYKATVLITRCIRNLFIDGSFLIFLKPDLSGL